MAGVSISLRNEPVELLDYSSTSPTGWPTDTWGSARTVWGRLVELDGSKTYNNGLEQTRIDAVVAVAIEETVDVKGVVRMGGVGGTIYKILAAPGRVRLREKHIVLARASKEQFPGL